jgi:hypothetical protein
VQRTYTEIDDELLEAVRKVAAEQDRDERDVIEEAIRRYLDAPATSPIESLRQEQSHRETRRFVTLLDRMGSRFDFDEDEATDVANAELHAIQEERRAGHEGKQR